MPRDLLKNRKNGNALNYRSVFRLAHINRSLVFITMKISGTLKGLASVFLIWDVVSALPDQSCCCSFLSIQMTVCLCLLISAYPDLTLAMIYHWRGLYVMSKLGIFLKCVILHCFACTDYVCLLEPNTNLSCVAFISRNHRFHRDRHWQGEIYAKWQG